MTNYGLNSFSKIKDYERCCNYITKYISKDCVRNAKNQVYFCSRGLKKATKYELKNSIDLKFSYFNDYCKIKNMSLNKLDKFDKHNLIYLTDLDNYIK